MKIRNTIKDIKIQIMPNCPVVQLGLQTVNKTFQMFGHAYSSSDLNKPILVGKQINGGRYDCWSHNFKSKKIWNS